MKNASICFHLKHIWKEVFLINCTSFKTPTGTKRVKSGQNDSIILKF